MVWCTESSFHELMLCSTNFKSRRILKYIIIHANSAFIMQFMQEYLSFILMCFLYLLDLYLPSTSVADPRMFIPDPNFSISDPRSRVKKAPDPQQTQISVTKLLEIWSVLFFFLQKRQDQRGETSITMVRDQYLTSTTFPFISHYPLPVPLSKCWGSGSRSVGSLCFWISQTRIR